MPNYNQECTKCGNKLHHKQVAFEKIIKLQTASALVAKPKIFTLKFCTECCANLLNQTLDSLDHTSYAYFVKRYGEES